MFNTPLLYCFCIWLRDLPTVQHFVSSLSRIKYFIFLVFVFCYFGLPPKFAEDADVFLEVGPTSKDAASCTVQMAQIQLHKKKFLSLSYTLSSIFPQSVVEIFFMNRQGYRNALFHCLL